MPKLPIGGVDEIRALGLKPGQEFICADPTQVKGGCQWFEECEEPCKGAAGHAKWTKDGKDTSWETEGAVRSGPGPVEGGYRLHKPVVGSKDFIVIDVAHTCYHTFKIKEQLEANGGMMEKIANEGETIMVAGSTPRDETVPGQGLRRIWDDGLVPLKIKPFPRPAEQKKMRDRVISAQKVKDNRAAERRKKIERFAEGITDGSDAEPVAAGTRRGPATKG